MIRSETYHGIANIIAEQDGKHIMQALSMDLFA